MKTEENIFVFPKSRIIREPVEPLPEQIQAMKSKSLHKHAEQICDDIFANFMTDFNDAGLDDTDEHYKKDAYFLYSVLSSLVYRNMGLTHELHTFVDENVKVLEKDQAAEDNEEDTLHDEADIQE